MEDADLSVGMRWVWVRRLRLSLEMERRVDLGFDVRDIEGGR